MVEYLRTFPVLRSNHSTMTNTEDILFSLYRMDIYLQEVQLLEDDSSANLLAIDDIWIEVDNDRECILNVEEITYKASTYILPENQW